jgi:glycosyltransferase involved in cell wall biosynthesis
MPMDSLPKVSIITPVFNGASYIGQTLDSIVNLNSKVSYECIVINDGSSDTSLDIISGYADYVRVFTQNNVGEAATVNRGLNLARGEYVLVVNADDPLLEGRLLELASDILDRDNSVIAVYPNWKVIDQDGNTKRIVEVEEYSVLNLVGRNKCLPGPGTVFRKSSALQIQGRNPDWKFVGDYDFWLRLSNLGHFQHIPIVLAQWREHSQSTSVAQRNQSMAQERIQVILQFLNSTDLEPDIASLAVSNSYYLAARLAYFDNDIDGRKLIIQGITKSKRWPSEASVVILFFIFTFPVSRFFLKLVPDSLIRKIL